eukprot:TRINITY_DN4085_c0_g2_i1.p1 TRINITY_DN4085_c0_g2~~TRINITY_DN4085_c0_g2_i1.p1  ORF type:complete len:210 (-),score=54.71 TRINITY_DN4085_c0_g2_i1:25-654(-)
MLIQAIHACAVKFPDIASSVVHILMDFLGDSNGGSAIDVILFVREVMEMYPDLRRGITERLLESLNQIKSSKVYRTALWILGEYTVEQELIDTVYTALKNALGTFPFVTEQEEQEEKERKESEQQKPKQSGGANKILADGTYATQSAITETPSTKESISKAPNLRSMLFGGDFFLGSVLASTLTKMVLRLKGLESTTCLLYTSPSPRDA